MNPSPIELAIPNTAAYNIAVPAEFSASIVRFLAVLSTDKARIWLI